MIHVRILSAQDSKLKEKMAEERTINRVLSVAYGHWQLMYTRDIGPSRQPVLKAYIKK